MLQCQWEGGGAGAELHLPPPAFLSPCPRHEAARLLAGNHDYHGLCRARGGAGGKPAVRPRFDVEVRLEPMLLSSEALRCEDFSLGSAVTVGRAPVPEEAAQEADAGATLVLRSSLGCTWH